jgi:AcrR family transcriptional regulator
MVQKTAARGRPRSFDTDEVLGRARDMFWRHGFAATSMDQLSAATGLHKPSLYGAFGDKKQLYLAALDNYLADARAAFGAAFALPDVFDAMRAVINRAIDKFTRADSGLGCFMMSTAMSEAGADPDISRVVRGSMESLERAFVRRFEQAITDGQIRADADPEALATIMVAGHYNISARARAGFAPEELKAAGERTLGLIRRLIGAA